MTTPPRPPRPPRPVSMLDNQPPEPPSQSAKNRWWMVMLRIFAGLAAGGISGGFGIWLGAATGIPGITLLPPAIVLGALVFVAIKFRRFGYVTGFVLAPFLVVITGFILLLIICGIFQHR